MEKIHGSPMGSAGKACENPWNTWEKPMEAMENHETHGNSMKYLWKHWKTL